MDKPRSHRPALGRSFALLLLALAGMLAASPSAVAPLAADGPDLQVQQEQQEATRFPITAVTLQPGWNLVGWMGATAVADATASIVGPFRSLFTYDAVAQDFRSFSPDALAFLNTLDDLAFGDGVWIFALEESLWIQPAPWWARSVDLLAGFNLAMWTGPNNTPIDEALGGLGSALVSAFIYDAVAQQFLVFGPDRPALLNTAEVLNYGDGVWLEVTQAVTWEQPALQRIGTQDITFVRRIARIDEAGAEVDITDEVLAVAQADLGPPISLRFGLTFREARSMSGRVTAENGVELPSITVTSGVVSRDPAAPDAAADLFLGDAERVFVVFTSAHLEQAFYNVDVNDLSELDFSAVESVAPGDRLTIDAVFAQTLEREGPLIEDGLTELEIFARRWNAGDLQILGVGFEDGERFAFLIPGLEGTAGAAEFSTAQLHVAETKTAVKWGAKGVGTLIAIGLGAALAPESFGTSAVVALGVLTFFAGSSAAVASNIDDLFPPSPPAQTAVGGTTVTGSRITVQPDGTIIVENGTVTRVAPPSTPEPPPPLPLHRPGCRRLRQTRMTSARFRSRPSKSRPLTRRCRAR